MHSGSDRAAAVKQAESFKPAKPILPNEAEEKVDLDEIEEEIKEVKEIEEVAEEEEKAVEEEAGEMIEQNVIADGADTSSNAVIDIEDYEIEDDEAKNHAALLALPPQGSEICITGLSSDISEEDLRIFCESVGQVTRFNRWNKRDSSESLYAFVEYKCKELAAKAVQELNNATLKESSGYCDRGFAFVEYYNHACADYSRNKMSDPKFKLYSNAPTVFWAFPKYDVAACQVRTIFVKNLPKNVTKDQLRRLFEHHGEITKVILPPTKFGIEYRIGFVHFAQRSSAWSALRNSEKYHLDGQVLECYLARPLTKKGATGPNTQEGPLLQSVPSQMGYGEMGGAAYGAPGFGVMGGGGAYGDPGYGVMGGGGAYGAPGPVFVQPMLYWTYDASSNAMVPTFLPYDYFPYGILVDLGRCHRPLVLHRLVFFPHFLFLANAHGGSGRSSEGHQSNDKRKFDPY